MLENTNETTLLKAVMVIHQMTEEEKAAEIARIREKSLHDEGSALRGARLEGFVIGYTESYAEDFANRFV